MPRNNQDDPKIRQVTLQFQVQEHARHKALFNDLKAKAEAVNMGLADFALLCVRWGFETAGARAQAHYDQLKAMRNATWDDEPPVAASVQAAPVPAAGGQGQEAAPGDRFREQVAGFVSPCDQAGCKTKLGKDKPYIRDTGEGKSYCMDHGLALKEAAEAA